MRSRKARWPATIGSSLRPALDVARDWTLASTSAEVNRNSRIFIARCIMVGIMSTLADSMRSSKIFKGSVEKEAGEGDRHEEGATNKRVKPRNRE